MEDRQYFPDKTNLDHVFNNFSIISRASSTGVAYQNNVSGLELQPCLAGSLK